MKALDLAIFLRFVDKATAPAKRVSSATSMLGRAAEKTRKDLRLLNKTGKQVKYLGQIEHDIGKVANQSDEAARKLGGLWQKFNAAESAGKSTKRLSQQIAVAQNRVHTLAERHTELKRRADASRHALRASGIDTRNLARAETELGRRTESLNSKLNRQQWLMRQGAAAGKRLGATWKAMRRVTVLGGAAASIGGAALGLPAIKEAAQFERYQVMLETIEGSADKAKQSMTWIQNFATKTPYQLDQVTEAYVKLRAYGMNPTNGLLRTLGDTSAGMSKDIMSAVEAIADAVTGENERLKEFGINANTKGNVVTYNYTDKKGVQQKLSVVKGDRDAIQAALRKIWDEKFSGGMDRQSKTLIGIWSNLLDMYSKFQVMVMDSGPMQALKKRLGSILNTLNNLADSGELQLWAELIGEKITLAIDKAWQLAQTVGRVVQGISQWANTIANAVGGWQNLATILVGIKLAGLVSGALQAATAFGALLPIIRGLGTAILFVGRALLLNPIGLTIAAIGTAAFLIWKNWDTVKAALSASWQWLQQKAIRITQTVKNAFLNFTPVGQIIQHWDSIKAGISNTLNWVGSLPAKMTDYGRRIIEGLGAGIDEKIQWVKDKIHGLANMLPDWLKDKLGIRSPSRVFATLGGHISEGLALGIDKQSGKAIAATQRLAKKLPAALPTALAFSISAQAGAAGMQPPAAIAPIAPLSVTQGQGMGGAQAATQGITNHYHIHVQANSRADADDIARQIADQIQKTQRGQTVRGRSRLYDEM